MINYLSRYVKTEKTALVSCPACGKEHDLAREAVDKDDWVVLCSGCGGTFGVVPEVLFGVYVKDRWTKKKNPVTVYVDFVVHRLTAAGDGSRKVRRFHGWVDLYSREIVQVG